MKGMKIISTMAMACALLIVLLAVPVQASDFSELVEDECRKSLAAEGLGDEYLSACVAGVKQRLFGNQPPRVGINTTCPSGTFHYYTQGEVKVSCAKLSYTNSKSCPAGQRQILIILVDRQVPMCVKIVSP